MVTFLFVFGSLRPGGGAFERFLARVALVVRPALLPDHALYGAALPYPFISPRHGSIVVGEAVDIASTRQERVLIDLDAYEGDGYVRRKVTARVHEGDLVCWAYLAAEQPAFDQLIASGDWLAWKAGSM